jgi:hypothetical protein
VTGFFAGDHDNADVRRGGQGDERSPDEKGQLEAAPLRRGRTKGSLVVEEEEQAGARAGFPHDLLGQLGGLRRLIPVC